MLLPVVRTKCGKMSNWTKQKFLKRGVDKFSKKVTFLISPRDQLSSGIVHC